MKLLRCFLAFGLVLGITSAAKADQLDFHMVVLDPIASTPILTAPFSFGFTPCVAGQLPPNVNGSYAGCFSAVNATGQDWVGLQLVFSNTGVLSSQPAGCTLDGSTDYFQNASCALAPDQLTYVLTFTTGVIANNSGFTIAEYGVDPSAFPDIDATVMVASTPEPASVWLLLTGTVAAGSAAFYRRQSSLPL